MTVRGFRCWISSGFGCDADGGLARFVAATVVTTVPALSSDRWQLFQEIEIPLVTVQTISLTRSDFGQNLGLL